MNPSKRRGVFVVSLLVLGLVAFAGLTSQVLAKGGKGLSFIKENGEPAGDEPIDQLISFVNEQLELQGANYRLGGVWMFTIGTGRPANRRLQRGTRWVPADPRRALRSTGTEDLTYMLDSSDLTIDVLPGDSEAAVDASFDTWSAAPHTFLDLVKVADDGLNHDFLDNFPAVPFFPPCPFPAIFDFTALPPNADMSRSTIIKSSCDSSANTKASGPSPVARTE